jgi:thioredoxin 1
MDGLPTAWYARLPHPGTSFSPRPGWSLRDLDQESNSRDRFALLPVARHAPSALDCRIPGAPGEPSWRAPADSLPIRTNRQQKPAHAAAFGRENHTNSTMSTAADVTDSTWESTVVQSDTPVLVDFWADWCMPCKSMGPLVDKLAEEFEGRLKVVKINTQDNTEVPARYGIISIPTFLIIKGGEVVHQLTGAMPYEGLKSQVEAQL